MAVVTFDEYLAIEALNWSTIKHIERSPLHFQHALGNPIEDRPLLARGRGFHTKVLEPDRFDDEYAVFYGERRAGKEWEAFKRAVEGRTILKLEEVARLDAMVESVKHHPHAARLLFSDGYREHVITWTDPATGRRCKARIDCVCLLPGHEAIVDLKSTVEAAARRFGMIASRLLYHRQVVWYLDGWTLWCREQRMPELELTPTLIAVESEAPHDVGVYYLTEEQIYLAREANNAMLAKLVECEQSGRWPGVAPEPEPLLLPAWDYQTDEDDLADELGLQVDDTEEAA